MEIPMPTLADSAHESRARRAAARVGLKAIKSRWRRDSIDNYGEFMLIDPYTNTVISGSRFDLRPELVIKMCAD
jgi:hypothetical protein